MKSQHYLKCTKCSILVHFDRYTRFKNIHYYTIEENSYKIKNEIYKLIKNETSQNEFFELLKTQTMIEEIVCSVLKALENHEKNTSIKIGYKKAKRMIKNYLFKNKLISDKSYKTYLIKQLSQSYENEIMSENNLIEKTQMNKN